MVEAGNEAIRDLNARSAEGREELRADLKARIAKDPPIPKTDPTTYEVSPEVQAIFARYRKQNP